ncbi:MAG: AAA family ATPase [Halioglobus sp.]|nr:AAA family ATPase [Halioglobus sp.]
MYYQYFGLKEAPFSIAVNPRYLFMSARHRDALAHLLYGVGAGGGFILLTGEVGTGKTTINRCLLEQLPQNTDIAMVLNPALNALELLATVCDEFGIEYDAEKHTLKTLTDKLHQYLLENHRRGRRTVLLIDEAQHLDFEVLEQIRLLTNLETSSEKLLQIVLIGQPELARMLERPELRQLNQRITARYDLGPLNLEETRAYIRHRLQVAGMNPEREIFPPSVVKGIYRQTRGIPRLINVLCDRILLGAYGRDKNRVDHDTLNRAAREVLGRDAGGDGAWRWPAAAAAGLTLVLLLVVGGGWLLLQPGQSAPPTPVAAGLQPQAPRPTQSPPSAEAVAEPAIAAREFAPAAVAQPAAQVRLQDVLLDPGESMGQLWQLHAQPPPDPLCPTTARGGVLCVEGEAGTWNELARYDRPLSLSLVTPERFSAEVLVLGIRDESAWLFTGDDIVPMELVHLAPLWTGQYRFLWRPPADFRRPVARGDQGPAVAEIARLFARLDAQPAPLAGDRFNRALERRVRLFQREHGLAQDGIVGVQTLLELNEQLGIAVTAAQARQRLRAGASAATGGVQ